MKKKYIVEKTVEIEKRRKMVDTFFSSFIEKDEKPWIMTDAATLHDFYLENENELIKKVSDKYGITLNEVHFNMPFWQLLDLLQTKNY